MEEQPRDPLPGALPPLSLSLSLSLGPRPTFKIRPFDLNDAQKTPVLTSRVPTGDEITSWTDQEAPLRCLIEHLPLTHTHTLVAQKRLSR